MVLVATGVFFLVLVGRANGSCVCVSYAASETVRTSPTPAYDVLSTGGHHYLFEQDPGLSTGQAFVSIFGRDSHFRSAIVHNQEYPGTSNYVRPSLGTGPSRFVIIGEGLFLLLMASLFLSWTGTAVAARRAIDRDRRAPLATISGRYEGSRLPRFQLATLGRSPFGRAGTSAFPILVQSRGEKPVWLVAPMARASEIKAFETALRGSDRMIEAQVHPNTGAVAEIRGPGGLKLELETTNEVDAFDRTAGLPLPRKRHLF